MPPKRSRRPQIPQRTRIFIGCEGDSERSYVRLLQDFADECENLHIHFDAHLLQPGAGDPLELIRRANERLRHGERHGPYTERAALIDQQGFGQNHRRDQQCRHLARQLSIDLILQNPDHEALLLHHLPGCQTRRPPQGQSLVALRAEWPDYRKGRSHLWLSERLDLIALQRACSVEHALGRFLRRLGFPV